jgi:SAM-dependent methyltransferase
MACRICGSPSVTPVGEVEYYPTYRFEVFDCGDCCCRFTQHLESVYESLHSNASSCYGLQLEMASRAKKLFDEGDLVGLRQDLCASPKNRFVIETIDRYPRSTRLLEIGCSRGYLTSYFILAGFDVVGVDISASALGAASSYFGPFFVDAMSSTIEDRAPYDVVYHIGTIGCVSDPVALTRSLLRMLKPGGKLLFNAPNALACWLKDQVWLDFAPPPDVVTLFAPGFWKRLFSDEACVTEVVENCHSDDSLRIWLRKFAYRWQPPRIESINQSLVYYKQGPPQLPGAVSKLRRIVERGTLSFSSRFGLRSFVPSLPTPFGLFVTLTKK